MKSAVKVFAFMLIVSQGGVRKLDAQTNEMQADRARRDMEIRWPAAYDPSVAPVFSHNELLIHADCHHTFARLSDATAWPSWLVIVKDVSNETPQKTGKGALYRLKIFNSPIQSRIVEFEADQRISWIPFGADETETRHGHYHAGASSPKPEIASSLLKRQASDLEIARTLPLVVISCIKRTNSG
jgi:hypothetical protein